MADRSKTKRIGFSFLGRERDKQEPDRHSFRPTVAFAVQQVFPMDEILIGRVCFHKGNSREEPNMPLCQEVIRSIEDIATENGLGVKARAVRLEFKNEDTLFDLDACFQAIDGALREGLHGEEDIELFVNMNTGTHAVQLALYIMGFAQIGPRPIKLLQVSPGSNRDRDKAITIQASARMFNLDFSSYRFVDDRITDVRDRFYQQVIQLETKHQEVQELFRKIANVGYFTNDTILLLGAPGTGKTRIAREIHNGWCEHFSKKAAPFRDANCAGLPEQLAESLLFGHEKGAFTGAQFDQPGLLQEANGGTLFLDEIGELHPAVQAKFLKALEEGIYYPLGSWKQRTSRFRLICATNRNLADDVVQGRFREDLYGRIRCWEFILPSLAQRRHDISAHLEHELTRWNLEELKRGGTSSISFRSDAQTLYLKFAVSIAALWCANFRDLQQSVARMATYAKVAIGGTGAGCITPDIVEEEIIELKRRWSLAANGTPDDDAVLFTKFLAKLSRDERPLSLIHKAESWCQTMALKTCEGVRSHAATLLYSVPGQQLANPATRWTQREQHIRNAECK